MKLVFFTYCFIFSLLLSFNASGQPGSLDVTFGNEGKVIIDDGWVLTGAPICNIQQDGKIIAGVESFSGNLSYSLALSRYLENGQPDYSYGFEGSVGQGYIGSARLLSIFLLNSQKTIELIEWGVEYLVSKRNTNGVLDLSFGVNGEVICGSLGNYNTMEIRHNEKIILAGISYENQSWKPTVTCLDTTGNLDQSFGKEGKCFIPDSTINDLTYSALQSNDKIVVVCDILDDTKLIIARINSDGIVDSSFGINGISNCGYWSGNLEPYQIVTDPVDNILIAGMITTTNGSHPFLMRLTPDGMLDSSFNENGFLTAFYGDSFDESWNTIAIEKDKKILVGGYSGDSLLLCSFLDDGTIDTAFGKTGTVKNNFGGSGTGIGEICIQEDGKIVATGGCDGDQMILRFHTAVSIGLSEPKATIVSFNVYPNPFQNQATLKYYLKTKSKVTISLLNIFGQTTAVFIDSKMKESGSHTESILFHSVYSPGMYFVKITCDYESTLINCEIY